MSNNFDKNNLIWIDLEMTGLNSDINVIIEIATVVTDCYLNILKEGPIIAIYQDEKTLSFMDTWNIKTHTKSGLINRVKKSKYNNLVAEKKTIQFLKKWVPIKSSPICGSSINYDRIFLKKYMPDLESYFHYRSIDVSTIKELVKRWKPNILKNLNFKNKKIHQAITDIYNSIFELSYYRKYFIQI